MGRDALGFRDAEGYTPLHVAAGACRHLQTVYRIAAARPASLGERDNEGYRPLDIIAFGGQVDGAEERTNEYDIMRMLQDMTRSIERDFIKG